MRPLKIIQRNVREKSNLTTQNKIKINKKSGVLSEGKICGKKETWKAALARMHKKMKTLCIMKIFNFVIFK
jgi:hypothetical protein